MRVCTPSDHFSLVVHMDWRDARTPRVVDLASGGGGGGGSSGAGAGAGAGAGGGGGGGGGGCVDADHYAPSPDRVAEMVPRRRLVFDHDAYPHACAAGSAIGRAGAGAGTGTTGDDDGAAAGSGGDGGACMHASGGGDSPAGAGGSASGGGAAREHGAELSSSKCVCL